VAGAVVKLDAFLSGKLANFEHDRAKVDRASTSQLSPWIHIGTLSVRYIFYRVRASSRAHFPLRCLIWD
jgi:deoxyribodipyrimidine photolyase